MKFELLHIYGPFSIHSYGLFIALGIVIFAWLTKKHALFKQLKLENKFTEILMLGIAAGLIGGRLLSIICEPGEFNSIIEMIAPWQGGFSILGSVLGVLIVLPLYLKKINIPILPFFDLIAIFAPLIVAIGRIGCFFSGCCHGITTTLPWAVRYTDLQSIAPLHIAIHPTQLYSSGLSFLIFILIYFFIQQQYKKPGQLVSIYLMLAVTSRFFVDFWRADRVVVSNIFSFTQLVSIGIFATSAALFYRVKNNTSC